MNTNLNMGPKLKNTREAMRLTIKEAADRLRINPRFLTMLEEENFAQALPLTFMKGYLRSYTRLLNFTQNEINLAATQLSQLMPQLPSEKITPPLCIPKNIKKDRWQHVLTFLIIFTLILLVSLWWKSHNLKLSKATLAQAPNVPLTVEPNKEHLAALVPKDEQTIAESTQPAIKTAKNTTHMNMAISEEPGLDLTDEE